MILKGQTMRIVKGLIFGLAALAIAGTAVPQPAAADGKENWDTLSTALVLGIAGGAELKTLTLQDTSGQMEFFKTMAATLALSEGLKAVVHEQRPDGSSDHSFPSAHAALAFAAAGYFDIRYGAQNKTLATAFYGAAALTALGRVEAKKHFFGDVAAGALIGLAFAHTFTTAAADMTVYPTGDGMGITYTRHF